MSLSEMFVTKSYPKGKKMARKANVLDFLMGPSREMAKERGTKETKAMINKQRAQKASSARYAGMAKKAAVKKGAEGPKRSVAKNPNPSRRKAITMQLTPTRTKKINRKK
jgi:hypothetical protein